MKKRILILVAILISLSTNSFADFGDGGFESNGLWKKSGNTIQPANDAWSVSFPLGGSLEGDLDVADDININFGDSQDASLTYETADANANALRLSLPEGDATNIPCLIIGDQTTKGTDIAALNGTTDPCIALLSNDGTEGLVFTTKDSLVHTIGVLGSGQVSIVAGAFYTPQTFLSSNNTYFFGNQGEIYPYSSGANSQLLIGTKNNYPIVIGSNANKFLSLGIGNAEDDSALYGTSATLFSTATDEYWRLLQDKTDTLFSLGTGDLKVVSDHQNEASTNIRTNKETLTFAPSTGDASKTTSALIPDGAFLVGLTTRVTTTATNCTSVSIGDGSDVDMFGATTAITSGTTTDNSDATAQFAMSPAIGVKNVTITANGGNCFDGVWEVVAHYIDVTAPTS